MSAVQHREFETCAFLEQDRILFSVTGNRRRESVLVAYETESARRQSSSERSAASNCFCYKPTSLPLATLILRGASEVSLHAGATPSIRSAGWHDNHTLQHVRRAI
jgi:hypothetical protein